MVSRWRSRPIRESVFRGEAAEVWCDGRQTGVLLRWELQYGDGWEMEAHRYTMDQEAGGREVEVRLFLPVKGQPDIEVRATGHIAGEYAADGTAHNEPLRLRGGQLWIPSASHAASNSKTASG